MKKPSLIKSNQKGVTLIELIIAIAIAGIIGTAATLAVHQVITIPTISNDHNIAINQVRNAVHWINRDALMAKPATIIPYTIDPSDPSEQNFLELTTWEDVDGNITHAIRYTFKDGKLQRYYDGDPGTPISQYINAISCVWDSGVLNVTITAQMGNSIETRTFEVKPRPVG